MRSARGGHAGSALAVLAAVTAGVLVAALGRAGVVPALVAAVAGCSAAALANIRLARTLDARVEERTRELSARTRDLTSHAQQLTVRTQELAARELTSRSLQERLTQQAFYDSLTGLANRSLFQRELAGSLPSHAGAVAVLFCDLDGFKTVNDTAGHDVGDALLGVVAERLRGCVRPSDVVARFGGDEFAVLVRDADAMTHARGVAERIATALATPMQIDGRVVQVGVSIGIAALSPDVPSMDALLRNADVAMYRAKARRGESVVVFDATMHDPLLDRVAVADDLRVALDGGDLVLHYQPTVSLATGRAVGVEALLRWYHRDRGVVAPAEFLGAAEESGMMDAIGRWTLFEACRQAAGWQHFAAPGAVFSVAVNVSAWQVTSELVDVVAGALTQAGLPASALLLEVTEPVLLGRNDEAIVVLRALKDLGVRIGLDDFGTGVASLSSLARFPVDVVKIDRSLVETLDGGGERTDVTRAIVRLGHGMNVATIAEGVERRGQCDALRAMGCAYGQGYLFSRPLPAYGVTAYLQGVAEDAPRVAAI